MAHRLQRELIYIRKASKLQQRWGNAIEDPTWVFVRDWPDERLEEEIKHTEELLRFDKLAALPGAIVQCGLRLAYFTIGLIALWALLRFVRWAWETPLF